MKLSPLKQCLPVRHFSNSIKRLSNSGLAAYGSLEVQRADMLNGMMVAAAKPLGAQISACTIMFQAGSRFEEDNQLGATHFVRAMTGSSGCAYSGFGKMRQLHQRGCYLTCTSDRQSIAFTLRCPLDEFPEMKYYLLDTSSRICYHDWELADIKPFIKDNLVRINPKQRVLDLLQRAFWAGPLGNSMFCNEARVDGMKASYLKDFVKNFSTHNCTVASAGLPYDETLKLAQDLSLEFTKDRSCARKSKPSFPRASFEYFDLGKGSDTWIAVAVPGCGTCDGCSIFKHSILAAACGVDYAQVGQHTLDCINQTPLCSMADDLYTEYRAFSISYMETGMFGVLVRARAAKAEEAARAAVNFLSNIGQLNAAHIDIGKKRLKLNLARHEEDCVQVSEGLALQLANNLAIDGPRHSFCIIDSISSDDVLATAKEIANRKTEMAIAVVGDISAVPPDTDLLNNLR